jgi:predicted CXXCH cytochrome family protein
MSYSKQKHQQLDRTKIFVTTILALILFGINSPLYSGSITDSRHDLSTSESPEVCVFCHAPHNANFTVNAPLWNRVVTDQAYTLYASSTLDSVMGQPGGVSKACLGCHDGVVAYVSIGGVERSTKHQLVNYHGFPDNSSYVNCERCHGEMYTGRPSNLRLGMDMGDDHPISMDYPTPDIDPDFNTPPDLQMGWGVDNARLFKGKVECASCHNVHDPDIYPFLNMSNDSADLCLTCHIK